MQWNPDILNSLVAPGISTFTTAEIPDLSSEFPQADWWITNHFLNTVLRARFRDRWRQVVLGFVRRAQNAFAAYHDARTLTLEYLDGNDPLNPRVRKYYASVSAWEDFVLQVSMAIELFNWLNGGGLAFRRNDGSKEQRLYSIANHVKHTSKCVDSGQCQESQSTPVWLANSGIASFGVSVSYAEASGILRDVAKLAETFQDPYKFRRESGNAD